MVSKIEVDEITNQSGDQDSGVDLSTNDNIKFKIAGSQKAMLDSSGNLLVGKTSISTGTVGAELRADGKVVGTMDGGNSSFNRKSSHGTIVQFSKDNTRMGVLGSQTSGFFIDGESGHVGLRFSANSFIPRDNGADTDNTNNLGSTGNRFSTLYAGTGAIETSDKNEKQDIASLTAKELKVANKLSALFKTYRWIDRVAEKGDKARTHTGIIAQDIQSAFSAEGLDASNYGLFTSDTWWEKDKEIYETKEEAPKDATEKTRLGVRYSELFSFIFSSIEARLTALEGK